MTHNTKPGFSASAVTSLAAWFFCNISTVILNKYLFKFISFNFPLALTAVHMFICTLGSLVAIHVLKLTPWTKLDRDFLIRRVFPLAFLFVLNIVLGNVSLRWVSVSFMQTVKASVPVFSVIIQVLFFGKGFERDVYVSLVPIVGGVVLASYTESEFNETGFYSALIASMVTALMAVVSGALLTTKLDSINLLYYTAPMSFVMLFPFAWIVEGTDISIWAEEASSNHYVILIMSGFIAYLLNVTTFLVIANTSALTYNIAGNFKVVFSILFSVYIFRNPISFMNGLGCTIAIIGVWYYNHIRQKANSK